MTCHEIENRLLDYEEGQLSAREHDAVAKHIAGCAHCQTFAQRLKQLDATLMRTVKAPSLSVTFQARLKQRIQATRVMSPAEIAVRKRQLQAEYEASLAQLRPFPLPSRKLLEGLGYAAVLAAVGLLAWHFLPQLTDALAVSGLNIPGQEFLPVLLVSALFVVMGLIAAFPKQVVRLREAAFAR